MIRKRYAVPALITGLALMGGTAAYAAAPGTFDAAAFSSFTSDQQAAIQKAFQIRKDADAQTKEILYAAGVDESKLHEAMRAQGDKDRAALDAALDSNDYAAFKALAADRPMADKVTEDVFAKLVQVRALEKSGDTEGAKALRESLGLRMGPGGPHGHGGPGAPADASK
jgi:hypothetical protein